MIQVRLKSTRRDSTESPENKSQPRNAHPKRTAGEKQELGRERKGKWRTLSNPSQCILGHACITCAVRSGQRHLCICSRARRIREFDATRIRARPRLSAYTACWALIMAQPVPRAVVWSCCSGCSLSPWLRNIKCKRISSGFILFESRFRGNVAHM